MGEEMRPSMKMKESRLTYDSFNNYYLLLGFTSMLLGSLEVLQKGDTFEC
jgi:hypothetical protein